MFCPERIRVLTAGNGGLVLIGISFGGSLLLYRIDQSVTKIFSPRFGYGLLVSVEAYEKNRRLHHVLPMQKLVRRKM